MKGRMSFPLPLLPLFLVAGVGSILIPSFRDLALPGLPEGDGSLEECQVGICVGNEADRAQHVSATEARTLLVREGILSEDNQEISVEWVGGDWLFISRSGKHDDGTPRYGHWYVDAGAKDWQGGFCRH